MIEVLPGTWWLYLLVGLGAGILSGALGVGGGVLVIPALVMILHVPQKGAQGMTLALMVPMALLGAVQYWRHGDLNVSRTVCILLIAGAVAGVIAGTEIAHRVSGELLRKIFAVFLLVIGTKMILTPEQPRASESPLNIEQRSPHNESEQH